MRPMLTTATETAQDSFAPATLESPDIAARPAPENGAGGAAQVLRREPAINSMFRRMCDLNASDLHMSSAVAPLVRKDGEMCRLHDAAGPLTSEMILALLKEIMKPHRMMSIATQTTSDSTRVGPARSR